MHILLLKILNLLRLCCLLYPIFFCPPGAFNYHAKRPCYMFIQLFLFSRLKISLFFSTRDFKVNKCVCDCCTLNLREISFLIETLRKYPEPFYLLVRAHARIQDDLHVRELLDKESFDDFQNSRAKLRKQAKECSTLKFNRSKLLLIKSVEQRWNTPKAYNLRQRLHNLTLI